MNGISRRGFLGGVSALALGGCATTAPKKLDKIRLASVGCGGMGGSATRALLAQKGVELVALCDVNADAFASWDKTHPGVPHYVDYRKMLAEMGDRFDAVQIGTPDHTHAYIAIDCMNAGKHVYVQKPLARTFEECEMMRAAQKRTGVVVQMGNQGHPGVLRYDVLAKAGLWGEVTEIEGWSDRPIWPQGMTEHPAPQPLPDNVTAEGWDCWCGPSADHGYNKAYMPSVWRGWWDYGCGAIGDMAVHNVDPAFWTFKLGLPVEIEGDTCGGPAATVALPKKSVIKMKFANGIKLVWYDGGNRPQPREDWVPGAQIKDNGLIVRGTKATTMGYGWSGSPLVVAAGGHAWNAESKKTQSAAAKSIRSVPMEDHYAQFVEACRTADPARCLSSLDYAAPFTEALLLGCISLRYPGEKLAFDPVAKRFTDKPEANAFMKASSRGSFQFSKIANGKPWWSFS
ncbi:MAG: Gfo/Idh/MocA family oxidoreductase [Kiritimatiellae bacterium]|nr:Gfo/Idh/MocA family oxidoreductase [Kiritimatiellia bacterium]